jgi:hypothetical protein
MAFLKGGNQMNCSALRFMINVLLTCILVVVFNSSAIAGGSFTFKWGKDSEPEQHQVKHKKKKVGLLPMHRPMVTGLNINTGIIPLKRFIMTLTGICTFT